MTAPLFPGGAGSGAAHTLSSDGIVEHPLAPGEVVWFSPGTVHRIVNEPTSYR